MTPGNEVWGLSDTLAWVSQVRFVDRRSLRGLERGETIPIQVGCGASVFEGPGRVRLRAPGYHSYHWPFVPVNAGHSPRRYGPGRWWLQVARSSAIEETLILRVVVVKRSTEDELVKGERPTPERGR